jgi:excisionase family DNA binding protein
MILTLEEAADYLRFHPSTVYRLARNGQLPARKIGKQWRFHREALDRWLRLEVPAETVPAGAEAGGPR